MDFKNSKFVKSMKNITPAIKSGLFKEIQDYKINSEYMDYVAPDKKKSVEFDNEKLENMVKESLIKEFGPEIKNSKSYNLLVDAVVHNLKKKQLEAFGDIKEELEI